MTDLARYAASAPLAALPYGCLEISHPAWPQPFRRVQQADAVTVILDGTPTVFAGWNDAGNWQAGNPSTDDSGRARRTLAIDDVDNAVLAALESVVEHPVKVAVRLWLFASTDTSTPLLRETYAAQGFAPDDDGTLQVECVSRDLSVLADPWLRHTRSNTPGLRGR